MKIILFLLALCSFQNLIGMYEDPGVMLAIAHNDKKPTEIHEGIFIDGDTLWQRGKFTHENKNYEMCHSMCMCFGCTLCGLACVMSGPLLPTKITALAYLSAAGAFGNGVKGAMQTLLQLYGDDCGLEHSRYKGVLEQLCCFPHVRNEIKSYETYYENENLEEEIVVTEEEENG